MSRNHVQFDTRRWARVRLAALRRAGYRSELSGRPGRLEVHHVVPLDKGSDPYSLDNLQVLTRAEHIALHERDHVHPGQAAWLDYLVSAQSG